MSRSNMSSIDISSNDIIQKNRAPVKSSAANFTNSFCSSFCICFSQIFDRLPSAQPDLHHRLHRHLRLLSQKPCQEFRSLLSHLNGRPVDHGDPRTGISRQKMVVETGQGNVLSRCV